MAQKQIGHYGDDGAITAWPEADITGQPYEHGVGSIAGIGNGCFVVLPINYIDDGALEALRAEHAPKPTPKVAGKGKKEVEASDESATE